MYSMAGMYSIADMQSISDYLLNHYLHVGHPHSVDDVLNCGGTMFTSIHNAHVLNDWYVLNCRHTVNL
jgi:hypothetical protein